MYLHVDDNVSRARHSTVTLTFPKWSKVPDGEVLFFLDASEFEGILTEWLAWD